MCSVFIFSVSVAVWCWESNENFIVRRFKGQKEVASISNPFSSDCTVVNNEKLFSDRGNVAKRWTKLRGECTTTNYPRIDLIAPRDFTTKQSENALKFLSWALNIFCSARFVMELINKRRSNTNNTSGYIPHQWSRDGEKMVFYFEHFEREESES